MFTTGIIAGANNYQLPPMKKRVAINNAPKFAVQDQFQPSFNAQNARQARANFNQVLSFLGSKAQDDFDKPLTLLYMADTHSSIDAIPKLKTAVNNFKSNYENSIVLHSGDFGLGRGDLNLQIDLLNNLGVDIATLGNHEFFVGSQKLAEAIKKADFMTLVSNLNIPESNPVKELFNSKKIANSAIKEINGVMYGFVGSTSQDVNKPAYDHMLQGMRVDDAITAIDREVKELESKGVNRIILLSHLGVDIDREIAQKVPGIDVISGGHTHTELKGIKNGINLFESPRDHEPVLILHSGSYGEYLGLSHLVFNKDGILQIDQSSSKLKDNAKKAIRSLSNSLKLFKSKFNTITTTENSLVKASNMNPDEEMSQILQNKLTCIANAQRAISADWPMWGSNHLGNLTADAMLDLTRAEIALVQPGGIRRDIFRGPIYAEYIRNQAMPFDSDILKVKLTGQQILDALNNGATCAGEFDHKPGLVQVGNLEYTFDMLKPPNERISAEDVLVGTFKRKKLDLNRVYTVAIDRFLHKGGENFDSIKDAEVIKEYPGYCHATALVEYLEKHQNSDKYLYLSDRNRIHVKNRPPLTIEDSVMSLKKRIRNRLEEKVSKIESKRQPSLFEKKFYHFLGVL